MFGEPFYHNILRKTTIGVGALFNNLWVVRKIDSGDVASAESERIKIPLSYGPKQKFLQKLNSSVRNEELEANVETILPRIGFELTGISYDPSRKTTSVIQNYGYDTEANSVKSRFNRVPYIAEYAVHIMAKNTDDANQIIEQILPYFTPEYSISVKLTELDTITDVNMVLENVTLEDTWGGSLNDRRVLIWNLTLKAKIWMIGPITTSGVITQVDVNIFDYYSGFRFEQITVTAPAGATVGSDLASMTGFNTTILTFESDLTTGLTSATGPTG